MMFNKMRKCLDDFETAAKSLEFSREYDEHMRCFYLDFAKAMLLECPDAEKVARVILVEYGLFDDIKLRFEK